jgi:hypothetical protein
MQLQERFDATRRTPPPVPAAGEPTRDPLDALKELVSLRDSGALTEAEFAAAKARLLDVDGDR